MSSSGLKKHEGWSIICLKQEERSHLMHKNTRTKSEGSVWICRADTVVIIAITVSALIALITLNWLLLSWSIITCDLSVTRLREFSGVSVVCWEQCSLSLLFEKSLQSFFISSREAPSDHKWLHYCFTDRKANICALNMQPDEILKSAGVPSELKRNRSAEEILFIYFFCFWVGGLYA